MQKQMIVRRSDRRDERGFTVVASTIAALAIFGMAGLAIDIGRMYITKNEAQSYADSAALYAAQQLNGTSAGLAAADTAVSSSILKWGFATNGFTGTTTEYSTDGAGGWASAATVSASDVPNIRYVRVTATVNNMPLYLLPVIGTGTSATIKARATAGQTPEDPPNSLFPYSPVANVDATSHADLPTTGDPYGWVVGQQYDLKWPHSAQTGANGANKVPCAGDNSTSMINRTEGGNDWGEIVMTSGSDISNAIQDDMGKVSVAIDQSVQPTTGNKSTELAAIQDRIAQDGDQTSTTISDYFANAAHNGRRLITVIVNNGLANAAGTPYPASQQAIGLGYAQFLLLTANAYTSNGGSNNPWCAIYVGPTASIGTPNGGGGGLRGAGVTVLRLVE